MDQKSHGSWCDDAMMDWMLLLGLGLDLNQAASGRRDAAIREELGGSVFLEACHVRVKGFGNLSWVSAVSRGRDGFPASEVL